MMWHCHLSGNHVVPNEDEVDLLVSSDAQRLLYALQVCCDVWQRGRFCPAVATQNTHSVSRKTWILGDNLSEAPQLCVKIAQHIIQDFSFGSCAKEDS